MRLQGLVSLNKRRERISLTSSTRCGAYLAEEGLREGNHFREEACRYWVAPLSCLGARGTVVTGLFLAVPSIDENQQNEGNERKTKERKGR